MEVLKWILLHWIPIKKINDQSSKPMTLEMLKTACIVNSKRLIGEIEKLENMILTTSEKESSSILLIGAKLEIIIHDMVNLENYWL